jgi:hypothetical protein
MPLIEIQRQQFTSGLEVDKNGTINLPYASMKYIGGPNPDVDEAWESLIWGKLV